LTAEYLRSSLAFYREAGESCTKLFDQCERNDWQRLLLCGVSELAEIATLRAMGRKVVIVGYFDPASGLDHYLGKPVWRALSDADAHDARLLDRYRRAKKADCGNAGLLGWRDCFSAGYTSFGSLRQLIDGARALGTKNLKSPSCA